MASTVRTVMPLSSGRSASEKYYLTLSSTRVKITIMKKLTTLVMIVLASVAGCSDDSVGSGISGEATASPFGPAYGFATTTLPSEPKGVEVLSLDGFSGGEVVTVALSAATVLKPLDQGPQSSPPLVTATIEYGSGTQKSFVEVDVPVGRISFVDGQLASVEDGATMMTLPGALKIWARNDSYYIVPDLSGLVGNAQDLTQLIAPSDSGDADDALVKAFASHGSADTASSPGAPTRTYIIGRGSFGAMGGLPLTFTNDPPRGYLVPPHAKRFKILRWDGTNVGDMGAFGGTVYDADNNGLYNFNTPVDTIDGWKDLPGVAHSVGLSLTITPPNGYAAIVWEIGI